MNGILDAFIKHLGDNPMDQHREKCVEAAPAANQASFPNRSAAYKDLADQKQTEELVKKYEDMKQRGPMIQYLFLVVSGRRLADVGSKELQDAVKVMVDQEELFQGLASYGDSYEIFNDELKTRIGCELLVLFLPLIPAPCNVRLLEWLHDKEGREFLFKVTFGCAWEFGIQVC